MNSSTALPALTSIITRRGFLSLETISSMRMRAEDLGALGFVGEEVVHFLDGAVVGHDGEAVVVHVQNEILAHDGQTDQCDVSLWFHKKLKNKSVNEYDTKSPAVCQQFFARKPTLVCHGK